MEESTRQPKSSHCLILIIENEVEQQTCNCSIVFFLVLSFSSLSLKEKMILIEKDKFMGSITVLSVQSKRLQSFHAAF